MDSNVYFNIAQPVNVSIFLQLCSWLGKRKVKTAEICIVGFIACMRLALKMWLIEVFMLVNRLSN